MEDIFEELAAAASDDDERVVQETRADEAEEVNDESRRVVKPKRTTTRAPRPKLDPARLLCPRGIFVLSSTFDNVKFKGKGRELDDLNNILSRLQHWAHRLFPKMTFEDCIERIEELGHKREIQVNMHKLRMGMVDMSGQQEQVVDDDDVRAASPSPPVDDAFDQLISTVPAPVKQITLTEEQRARMMRNRLLAEERRMARRLAREKELSEQRQAVTTDPGQNETQSVGNAMNQEPNEVLPTTTLGDSTTALFPTTTLDDSTTALFPTTILGDSTTALFPTTTLDDSTTASLPNTIPADSTPELLPTTVLADSTPDDSYRKERIDHVDIVPHEFQKQPTHLAGGVSVGLASADCMDVDVNDASNHELPPSSIKSP